MPILANVLLSAADGRLSLTATDLELDLVESADCDVSTLGAATAPAHMLHDIVRKFPEDSEVRFEVSESGEQVTVRAGRSTFRLPGIPAADFPVVQDHELPVNFVVSAADIRTVIDRTRFAMANEETRHYLNGIFLHAAQVGGVSVMRAVATDGHRLARVEIPLPHGAKDMPAVILPRKAVGELRKLLDDRDGEVSVSLSDARASFACDSSVLTTKLIEGQFPDYERVIPQGNNKNLRVDRRAFADAVDRVATIATERSRSVKLELNDGVIVLSANNQDNGTAREEVEAVYGEAPMEIGFNARYLLDIANQIGGDGTLFRLGEPGSPAIVRDSDDDSSLYVIMPMRV